MRFQSADSCSSTAWMVVSIEDSFDSRIWRRYILRLYLVLKTLWLWPTVLEWVKWVFFSQHWFIQPSEVSAYSNTTCTWFCWRGRAIRLGSERGKGCISALGLCCIPPPFTLVHQKALGTPVSQRPWSPRWGNSPWWLAAMLQLPTHPAMVCTGLPPHRCPQWCFYHF